MFLTDWLNGLRQCLRAMTSRPMKPRPRQSYFDSLTPRDVERLEDRALLAVLNYSTYLGGDHNEIGGDVAIDGLGNTYVIGTTNSGSIVGNDLGPDNFFERAFLAKYNPDGELQYVSTVGPSLILTGNAYRRIEGISVTVGLDNSVYMYYMVTDGDVQTLASSERLFVTKLDAQGTEIYDTEIPVAQHRAFGSSQPYLPPFFVAGSAFTTDVHGNAYAAYHMLREPQLPNGSAGFPETEYVIAKIDVEGHLLFSENLSVLPKSLAVDASQNIYVFATTGLDGLDVSQNALQSTRKANPLLHESDVDVYVAKLNPTATLTLAGTYLGGTGIDLAGGIAIDPAVPDVVYLAGGTASDDFPTQTPIQNRLNNSDENHGQLFDGFISSIDLKNMILRASTYLGGSADQSITNTFGGNGNDILSDIALDREGHVYVVGESNSLNYPVTSPLQASYHFGPRAAGLLFPFVDLVITKLDRDLSTIEFSTYFGGSGQDSASAFPNPIFTWNANGPSIAVDVGGNVVVTGTSKGALAATEGDTADFPTAHAAQPDFAGGLPTSLLNFGAGPTDAVVVSISDIGQVVGRPINVTQDLGFRQIVAEFTSHRRFATAGEFEAEIDWGDGTGPTLGSVRQIGASYKFVVEGAHTYFEPNTYPIVVRVTDLEDLSLTPVTNLNVSHFAGSQTGGAIAVDYDLPNSLFMAMSDEESLRLSQGGGADGGLIVARSNDGGATWSPRQIATLEDPVLPPAKGSPDVLFDKFGNLFLAYLGAKGNEMVLTWSTDDGATFVDGIVETFPGPGNGTAILGSPKLAYSNARDELWLTFEKLDTGQIYVASMKVNALNDFSEIRFEPLATAVPGNFSDIAVGPTGAVAVAWQQVPAGGGDAQMVVSIDPDGRGPQPFSAPSVIATSNTGDGLWQVPAQSQPIPLGVTLAWDTSGGPNNGRLYAAYVDVADGLGSNFDAPALFLTYSTSGTEWTEPLRVFSTPNFSSMFLPSIALDRSNGALALGWYGTLTGDDHNALYFTATSSDGVTFSQYQLVSTQPSNPAQAADNPSVGFGEAATMVFNNGRLYPVWADNSDLLGENYFENKFEVATAVIGVATVHLPPINIKMLPIAVSLGDSFDGAVATFNVADPNVQASAFTAEIEWGDGSRTAGTVVRDAPGQPFEVVGTHSYATVGQYPLRVHVLDKRTNIEATPVSNVTVLQGTQNQPSIAIDPLQPDHVFAAGENLNAELPRGLLVSQSIDGGLTWTARVIADGTDNLPAASGAARVAYDHLGNLFLTYLTAGPRKDVAVIYSTNGGADFAIAVVLSGEANAEDVSIATGPGVDSLGSVWVTWVEEVGPVLAAGARVNGLGSVGTFTREVVSPYPTTDFPLRGFGDVAIGPNGKVLVTYDFLPGDGQVAGPSKLMVHLDPDGLGLEGFGPAVEVGPVNLYSSLVLPAYSVSPVSTEGNLVWDRSDSEFSGRVYLVYMNSDVVGSADTDIFIRYSDDDGAHWTEPIQINDTNTNSQFLPSVAIDEGTGDLAVGWYSAVGPTNIPVRFTTTISDTGGVTWNRPEYVMAPGDSTSFDVSLDQEGRDLGYGSISGLSFVDGFLQAIWVDNSHELPGNPDPRRFELAAGRLSIATVFRNLSDVEAVDVHDIEGKFLSLKIATFTDSAGLPASAYHATIDWGDGTNFSKGTVVDEGNGNYAIFADHTYQEPGHFTITVDINGLHASGNATSTADIDNAFLDVEVEPNLRVVREAEFTKVVATLVDLNVTSKPEDFIVSIEWGDGFASLGTLALRAGSGPDSGANVFEVTGTHRYLDENTYTLKVSALERSTGQVIDTNGPIVSGDPTLQVEPGFFLDIQALEGVNTGDLVLVTFTVPEEIDVPLDTAVGAYRATINWGDGEVDSNILPFVTSEDVTVTGRHTYAAAGQYFPTVTVQDDSGGVYSVQLIALVEPDVTSQVRVVGSGLVFDPVTQKFVGELNITNKTTAEISGPLYVVIHDLPAGVTLDSFTDIDGQGNPLFKVNQSRLSPGASLPPIPLEFSNPAKVPISYSVQVFDGLRPDVTGGAGLIFEPNRGQVHESIDYITRGQGYAIGLSAGEAALMLSGNANQAGAAALMRLVGANASPVGSAIDVLSGVSNYLSGTTAITGVPHFGRVHYQEVYAGIDVEYYGRDGLLEYDWFVKPGADVDAIALRFDGIDGMTLDGSGNLRLQINGSQLVQRAPIAYQYVNGSRYEVLSAYELNPDGTVGFTLGSYDHSLPLIIDPVLVYSTYYGGSGIDVPTAVAVDDAGNTYVTGDTGSIDFFTVNPFDPILNQPDTDPFNLSFDAFVTKLDPNGVPVFSTYLGGGSSGFDPTKQTTSQAIAVTPAGQVWIAGFTQSLLFPTTTAAPTQLLHWNPGEGTGGAFLTELSADGSALVYSTVFEGPNIFNDIAVDAAGKVYATSRGTVLKIDASLNAVEYTANIGAEARAMAIDDLGQVYLTGSTNSTGFPVKNALFPVLRTDDPDPSNPGGDGFVVKLGVGGLVEFATYLGGSRVDSATDIAVDPFGVIYVVGTTNSTDLPVPGGIQTTYGGNVDGYLIKLANDGSAVLYGTYIGGASSDYAFTVAVDDMGRAYIGGSTASSTLPVTPNAHQPTSAGGSSTGSNGIVLGDEGFAAALQADGSGFDYFTYLGGTSIDDVRAVAVDGLGNASYVGRTSSTNFPFRNAAQTQLLGTGDAFIVRLLAGDAGTITLHNAPLVAVEGAQYNGTVAFFETTGSETAAQFSAIIDWGDGLLSPGIITGDFRTGFQIKGNHVYQDVGTHDVFVTLLDARGQKVHVTNTTIATAQATGRALYHVEVDTSALQGTAGKLSLQFNPGAIPGSPDAEAHISGLALTGGSLGSVTFVGNVSQTSGTEFTLKPTTVLNQLLQNVNLGSKIEFDVEFSGAGLSQPQGSTFSDIFALQLLGTNGTTPLLSADASGSALRITVAPDGSTRAQKVAPGVSVAASGLATIANGPINLQISPITIQEGLNFNLPVATFTNGNPSETAEQFVATIDWGDGTPVSPGVIVDTNGQFTITGTHIYQEAGAYSLTVTVTEPDGNSVSARTGRSVLAGPTFKNDWGGNNFPPDSLPVTGDFNGDNILDIAVGGFSAVPTSNGRGVGVFLGRGDGSFALAGFQATGQNAIQLAVGDFNNDTKLDVAAAISAFGQTTVEILFGNGDGTLQAPVKQNDLKNPGNIVIADFNHDGKVDLAYTEATNPAQSAASTRLNVGLGAGNGTFALPVSTTIPVGFSNIFARDVNSDGNPDVILASSLQGTTALYYLEGLGNGSFQAATLIASGTFNRNSVAFLDFDGDAKQDIAAVDGTNLNVFSGNGDGTFDAPLLIGAVQSSFVATADFNRDGLPDLATTEFSVNNDLGRARVYLNNGANGFANGVAYEGVSLPTGLVPGDFDGDGNVDLGVSANATVITVLGGFGDGTFASAIRRPVGLSEPQNLLTPRGVETTDINGDGFLDAVIVMSDGRIVTQLGHGDGTFETVVTGNVGSRLSPVLADVNGDGELDVIAPSQNSGIAIVLGSGDGAFPTTSVSVSNRASAAVALADFNQDGRLDMAAIYTSFAGNKDVGISLANPDGTFQAPVNYLTGAVGGSDRTIAVGNINGDAFPDLLIANSSGVLSILLGNANGTFGTASTITVGTAPFQTGISPQAARLGDFNNDGKADIVAVGFNGKGIFLPGNGNGTFSAGVDFVTNITSRDIAVGDLNNDGKLDIVTSEESGEIFTPRAGVGGVTVLLGNGDGTFQAHVDYLAGANPNSIAVVDFNGDGRADVAAANFNGASSSSGSVSILLSNPNGTLQPAVNYTTTGLRPRSITTGDINGDQKVDLAIFDQSNDTAILLGNGNGTFQPSLNYFTSGDGFLTGSIAIGIGNLNGDNFADIVSGNTLLFGNGTGAFPERRLFTYLPPVINVETQTSNPEDIAAGDLNGDSKIDLAISMRGTTVILFGNGNGSFLPPVRLVPGPNQGIGETSNRVAILDMDNDGDLDVVTLHQKVQPPGGGVAVWRNDGLGVFTTPLVQFIAMPSYDFFGTGMDLEAGDLNGDGFGDIVVADSGDNTANGTVTGGVSVLLGVGDGSLAQPVRSALPPRERGYRVELADLNRDGRPEILVLTNPFGVDAMAIRSTLAILTNDGSGAFTPPTLYDHGQSAAEYLAAGDSNGDGAADILIPDSLSFSSVFGLIFAGEGPILVTDAPVDVTALDLNPRIGQAFTTVVATFIDANPFEAANDFTATIDWGDGQSSVGTVRARLQGGFEVVGTHTYATTANFTATVTVREIGGSTHVDTATARVTQGDQLLTANAVTFGAMEDLPFTGIVASFTDANPNGSVGDFTALISWGDNQTSAGTIVPRPGGGFNVLGTHTYANPGNLPVRVDITDIAGSTGVADSTAQVAPHVNQAPIAADDSYSTGEDTPLVVVVDQGVLGNDTDAEGNPLTAVLVSNASHGNVTLNANGSFTYTPALNFNGADSFSYRANDASINSNVATVTITVRAIADPPTANSDSQATNEDTPVVINVLANDTAETGNLDPATVTFITLPVHGAVTVNPVTGAITYTPFGNYAGGDSLQYKVADSSGLLSNVATVSITVTAVNDAPQAVNDHYATNEDTPLTIAAAQGVLKNDSDIEGTSLSASVVTQPAHGTLTLNSNGSFTYTPAANYAGPDSFTYRVSDGTTSSALAKVSLIVVSARDAATIGTIADKTINEGTTFTTTGTFADPDPGDTWIASVDYGDGTGVQPLSLNGTSFSLSHNYADSGQYTVTVIVTDQAGSIGTLAFQVIVQNLAPSVQAGNDLTSLEGVLIGAQATFTDPGTADTHTATINWGDGSTPQSTAIIVIGGISSAFASHAYADEGTYTVTVTVTDDEGAASSDTLTVTISNAVPRVTAGNDQSTFVGTAVTLPIVLTNEGFEAGFGPFTFQTVAGSFVDTGSQDTHIASIDWGDGTVEPVSLDEILFSPGGIPTSKNGTITATHAYTSVGEYTVVIRVTDNDGGVGSDSFAVTVNEPGANVPPVATNDSIETNLNTGATINVLSNDNDADGTLASTTVTIVTGPSHGTAFVNPATGVVTYSPANNYLGPDSFTYTVKDNLGAVSNVATVNITVTDHTPVITSAPHATVPENLATTSIVLDVNATDADQPPQILTYGLSGPDAALFNIDQQGRITFVVSPDYETPDDQGNNHVYNLTVTVSDNGQPSRSTSQDLTITVTPLNDNSPTFAPPPAPTLPENSANGTTVATITATDLDQPQQSVAYAISAGNTGAAFAIDPTTGEITVANSAALDFETNPSFLLTITATDNGATTLSASITVTFTLTDVAEGNGPQLAINGPAVTWYKKLPPVSMLPNVTFAAGEAPLAGGTLVITVDVTPSKKKPFDQFNFRLLKAIGDMHEELRLDGRELVAEVHFDGRANEAALQAALRDITFVSRGKGRKNPERTMHLSITDSSGLTVEATQKVNVLRKRPKP